MHRSVSGSERSITLCLTGGGTAGHVTPLFALLPGIERRGWTVFYIGSAGLERSLAEAEGLEFHVIAAGKLRRYFSLSNFVDVFRVGLGVLQAFWILRRKRPDVVFSKGGFVAVPVAVAAWLIGIPVVSHESDLTPGLATRLISPLARKILCTFTETRRYLKADAVRVGPPIREDLFRGDRRRGLSACGFNTAESLPTLFVTGGSLGAQRLNEILLTLLPDLLARMRVIHLTGKGKALDFTNPRYKQFEFVREGLNDLFAASDLFLGRAGSNSIFEALALRKPMLLVPLEAGSRGDQVLNAEIFKNNGWALVLREADLTPNALKSALDDLEQRADSIRNFQGKGVEPDAAERILNIIADLI